MRPLALAALLATTACGPGEAATTPPDTVGEVTPATTGAPGSPGPVLVVEEVGGCAMMGPNCATYVLWSDGTAALYRSGLVDVDAGGTWDPDDAEAVAEVPAETVADVVDAVAATDFTALRDSLEPGTCLACVDGIDLIVTVFPPEGPPETIGSAEFAFDLGMPLFRAAEDARLTMARNLGGLAIVQR